MIKFRLLLAVTLGLTFALGSFDADARRERDDKKAQKVKEDTPSKTGRVGKKAESSQKFSKAYAKAAEKYEADDFDGALVDLTKLDGGKTTPYEKAKIAQLRGYVYYNQDDLPKATEAFKAALATDALNNEEHFQLKLTLAELYHMNDQLPESIAAFDDWLKDAEKITGRNWALQAKSYFDQDDFENTLKYLDKAFATGDKAEKAWYQMKANSLLSLERTDDAIAFGKKVLAAQPDDLEFVNFQSALLLDAEKPQEALNLLEPMRAAGKLTKENLYINLHVAYADLDRPKDAAAVLREGIDKGIVVKTSKLLMKIGETFYDADDQVTALDYFKQAAALSPDDGTADFNVGTVLLDQEKAQEARAAFATAIQKGKLKQLGNAYYQLGSAELDSGNEAAAIAAFKKAQAYPESAKNATQVLKSLGR
jgi:tetratricopeptide (TPR) repeat protein